MALKTLLEKLDEMTKKMTRKPYVEIRSAGEEIISDRVIFPPDWRRYEAKVERSSWRDPVGYYLSLHGIHEGIPAPLLTWLLEQTRSIQFAPGTFEVKTEVSWPAETFLKECNLGALTELRVHAYFNTVNPMIARTGPYQKSHELAAELTGRSLQVSASGKYSFLLPQLIRQLKIGNATIRLSPIDAQRWLNNSHGRLKKYLQRELQPQKRVLPPLFEKGMTRNPGEVIEIVVPAYALSSCADTIGLPLINEVGCEETFVSGLTKTFWQRKYILPALKILVQALNEFETSTLFGKTLLLPQQAKEFLDQEIGLILKSFQNPLSLGVNTHLVRRKLIMRLVHEHFGPEIFAPLDKLKPDEYLDFLKKQGYVCVEKLDEWLGSAEKKERYLFLFFLQSYTNDPGNSVEQYRQCYVNPKPTIRITGITSRDASKISKFSLPKQALLTGFSLKENSKIGDEEIAIWPLFGNTLSYDINVPLDTRQLFDLQEETCRRIGIVFK